MMKGSLKERVGRNQSKATFSDEMQASTCQNSEQQVWNSGFIDKQMATPLRLSKYSPRQVKIEDYDNQSTPQQINNRGGMRWSCNSENVFTDADSEELNSKEEELRAQKRWLDEQLKNIEYRKFLAQQAKSITKPTVVRSERLERIRSMLNEAKVKHQTGERNQDQHFNLDQNQDSKQTQADTNSSIEPTRYSNDPQMYNRSPIQNSQPLHPGQRQLQTLQNRSDRLSELPSQRISQNYTSFATDQAYIQYVQYSREASQERLIPQRECSLQPKPQAEMYIKDTATISLNVNANMKGESSNQKAKSKKKVKYLSSVEKQDKLVELSSPKKKECKKCLQGWEKQGYTLKTFKPVLSFRKYSKTRFAF